MTVREVITQLRHDMLVDFILAWADEDPAVFGHHVEELARAIMKEVEENKKEVEK